MIIILNIIAALMFIFSVFIIIQKIIQNIDDEISDISIICMIFWIFYFCLCLCTDISIRTKSFLIIIPAFFSVIQLIMLIVNYKYFKNEKNKNKKKDQLKILKTLDIKIIEKYLRKQKLKNLNK